MSRRTQFYRLVSEAVADFVEHGFDSQQRLDQWLESLRTAASRALIPESELAEVVRGTLTRSLERATAGIARKHEDLPAFTLEKIRPQLRAELDRRILSSANLIRLNRQASIERTLQRFAGWASSVPKGGSDITNRREAAQQIRRSIAGLPFEERRVIIDQSHKLVAAVDDIVARDGGAIAMRWQHIAPGPHYESRPEHLARNGKVFLIRGSWADKDGLVKLAGHQYLDQIDQPGEKIFCLPGESRIPFADGVEKAYRRWYGGELTTIVTESGKALRVTPNHPVLTVNGWIAAGVLNEGDYVVEIADNGVGLVGVAESNDDEAIPTIADIFGFLNNSGAAARIRGSAFQFHGDGTDSDVDVVDAIGPLRIGVVAPESQRLNELEFSKANNFGARLRSFELFLKRGMCSLARSMSRLRIGSVLRRSFLCGDEFASCLAATDCSAGPTNVADDHASADAKFSRKRQNAFSSFVRSAQRLGVQVQPRIRMHRRSNRDICAVEAPPKRALVESENWSDLGNGLPLGAKPVKVIKVERSAYSGHVFNLQTTTGWYVAEGIITHNCSCTGTYIYSLRGLPPEMLTEKGRAVLTKPAQDRREYDANGWFEVLDNPLSKVGVFEYSGRSIGGDADPEKRYGVYRSSEELSSPECVESFRLQPWIDDHPPTLLGDQEDGLVPSDEKGVRGVTGEKTYFKDGTLYGNIKVFSQALARKIASGKRELSLGYRCDWIKQDGVFEGQPYQYVQKNIRGNHVASVDKGRMGSEVRVLDAAERFTFALDLKEPAMANRDDEKNGTIDEATEKLIADSFNSLVSELEKKGYSKEYATKIAGKVANEKREKGDSKDAGGEEKDPAGGEEDPSEKGDLEPRGKEGGSSDRKAAKDRRAKDEEPDEDEDEDEDEEEAEDEESEEEEAEDAEAEEEAQDVEGFMKNGEFHPIRGSKGYSNKKAGGGGKKKGRKGKKGRRGRDSMDAAEVAAIVDQRVKSIRTDAVAAQRLYQQLSPLIGAFDHDDMSVKDMASYGLKKLGQTKAADSADPMSALDCYLAALGSTPQTVRAAQDSAASGGSFLDKYLAA